MSKVYSFKTVQFIPASLDEVWNFFSVPDNLEAITPTNMPFKVTSKHHGSKIYPGQIIEYKVSPLFGIPMYWMTEIVHVQDKVHFVDEQRYGPYSLWHHQHHFKDVDGGVEMTDIVHYKMPFWFLGDIANTLLVKKKLKEVFDFRWVAIEKKFGKSQQ
jgi:ligand-binding SRPBCC domain-containing protein